MRLSRRTHRLLQLAATDQGDRVHSNNGISTTLTHNTTYEAYAACPVPVQTTRPTRCLTNNPSPPLAAQPEQTRAWPLLLVQQQKERKGRTLTPASKGAAS